MSARCSFAVDTAAVAADLDREGHAVVPGLLDAATAEELVAGFDDDHRYRSTIDMARHGYGVGTYRYFAYPLPPTVAALREQLYRQLVPIADEWAERLGTGERYPDELPEFLARCAAAGQERPTPLILRYRPGHYNCLHQDRYGEVAFPLQVAILLTPPRRVRRWRAGAGRAAAAGAVPRPRGVAPAGRRGGLPEPGPPGARHPRPVPGARPPWRRHPPARWAARARRDLPRRRLIPRA